jgi:eukaryotic-like serine/threonine-protein kinase
MKQCDNHASDGQLRVLLFDQEDSLESMEIAEHVESCESCQIRLTEMVNEASIETETSQLLIGYAENDRSLTSSGISTTQRNEQSESDFDKVFLQPPTHPEMLGRIGRYEIERRIGSGGMGVVFKAIDTELNRPVAVKVLAPHLARNGAARQRFSRESRAAAAVVHEHVVAIHNVDSTAEHPYLVMQYVSGESLQSRVEREGPLGVERILRIGVQAALGLSAAHQQGIVHRDIKPANILLEDGVDRLLITDFGLARTVDDASLTHTGVVAGTPNYMSPEQASGDEVDHRTDLFSLGSVLYFVATGHPPFRAERAMGVLHRICRERHRPVWQINTAIPDELSTVIDRLLEKRPARRFANAAAVADSLTRILHQRQNRRPSLTTRLRSWERRHQMVSWTAATALIAAAGLLAWSKFLPNNQPGLVYGPTGNGSIADESFRSRSMDAITESTSGESPTSRDKAQPAERGPTALDIVGADRVEFDRSLQSVNEWLNRQDNTGSAAESDSFSDYRLELSSLEQTLRAIDPTK